MSPPHGGFRQHRPPEREPQHYSHAPHLVLSGILMHRGSSSQHPYLRGSCERSHPYQTITRASASSAFSIPGFSGCGGPLKLMLRLSTSLPKGPIKLLLSADGQNMLQTRPTLTSEHNVTIQGNLD